MNRKISTLLFILALSLGFSGCKKEIVQEDLLPFVIQENVSHIINGKEYSFLGNTVRQITKDADNKARYGIISDIHGEVKRAEYFAKLLKEKNVEGIILTGDLIKNEELRGGEKRKDEFGEKIRDKKSIDYVLELESVLSAVAKTNLPIFVIPGNHETKNIYEKSLFDETKRYENIIDMTVYRRFIGDHIDFVSLPGYQIRILPGRKFIPDDGYFADKNAIDELLVLRDGLTNPVVLVTHGPPYTGAHNGPGTIADGTDVGEKYTSEVMRRENISFAVFGHIHEAGGLAATLDGKEIMQKKWAKSILANFGTLEDWEMINGTVMHGMAGILTIQDGKGMYEMVYEDKNQK